MRDRTPTEFEQKLIDTYNESTPKQQRVLDLTAQRLKASALASPRAVFHLFPALRKPLILKDPA